MRKILTKKFWSQGTSQGSLGSGSGADVRLGACQFQILVIWGPHEPPVLVALQAQAKKLKTVPAWCVKDLSLTKCQAFHGVPGFPRRRLVDKLVPDGATDPNGLFEHPMLHD